MKVLMQTTAASPERILDRGKVYNLPPAEAQALLEGTSPAGFAYAVPAPADARPERIPHTPDPEDTPEGEED